MLYQITKFALLILTSVLSAIICFVVTFNTRSDVMPACVVAAKNVSIKAGQGQLNFTPFCTGCTQLYNKWTEIFESYTKKDFKAGSKFINR